MDEDYGSDLLRVKAQFSEDYLVNSLEDSKSENSEDSVNN